MLFDHIICHYGEIALKGKNRDYFEDRLIQNIKSQLELFAPGSFDCVKKISGAILIKLNETGISNSSAVNDALLHTFGIVNFSFAGRIEQNIETMKHSCWNLIKDEQFGSFRITTTRSNKQFPMTSEQVDREVGDFVFENFHRTKKVSLKNPDCNCQIIITNDFALVFLQKIKGLGGMPVGTGGKAMVMMSGGFDSPISAWYTLKRGVQLRYVHFHSAPYTSKASIEKVSELVSVLGRFGSSQKLYLVPFADVQKEIMMKCPEKLRVILYRRMMVRIAEALAKREKCLALVTGDSIAQVASQTLENIAAVSDAATLPIFRPLSGFDKEEIMQKARDIGTYDISKLPHDDCCTRLMPKNPETKARLTEVLEAEKALNVEELARKAFYAAEIL